MTPVEYRIYLLEGGQPLPNKIIKCQEKILDSIFFYDIITNVLFEKGV